MGKGAGSRCKLEELLTRASDDMDVASLGRIFLQELNR